MEFGKLLSVDQVDFRLPSEPPYNKGVLAAFPKPHHPGLYIGPTGYNMKPWVGKWYPPGAREKDFLRHFSTQFNTIEFNTTYYRMPNAESIQRWKAAVSPDFRFCPKVPQSISHARDLGISSSEPLEFCKSVTGLGPSLGCCFMQLPPHFGPHELPFLARFLESYASKIPLAVELRHPAFFISSKASDDCFNLLTQRLVTTVITDVAGRRDVCHMRLTNNRVLIRFVGNALHPSDYSRVEEWAGRLKNWFQMGLQEAYFFCHEPDNLLAPELTSWCVNIFAQAMPEISIRGPKPVSGKQGSLFDG